MGASGRVDDLAYLAISDSHGARIFVPNPESTKGRLR